MSEPTYKDAQTLTAFADTIALLYGFDYCCILGGNVQGSRSILQEARCTVNGNPRADRLDMLVHRALRQAFGEPEVNLEFRSEPGVDKRP